MSTKTSKGNRWYDHLPQLYRAVEMLEKMPPGYRLIIAKGIIQFTDENNLLGTPEELKSLGHEKVLGLIQSKAKRRWYDHDPALHRAVNNILLMDDEDRSNVAYRMVVTLESLESYMERCRQNDVLIDPEEIEQLVNDIFSRSLNELLDITDGGNREAKHEKPEPDKDSKVVSGDEGMKVSAIMTDKKP